jgi:hypothetical protein
VLARSEDMRDWQTGECASAGDGLVVCRLRLSSYCSSAPDCLG